MKWTSGILMECPIQVGLCLDENKYMQMMRRKKVNNPPPFVVSNYSAATAHFFTSDANKRVVIVCLRTDDDLNGIQIASLLVHEAVHIWQDIKENIGEHSPSMEFEAYSIQMLSQELMNLYVKLCQTKMK